MERMNDPRERRKLAGLLAVGATAAAVASAPDPVALRQGTLIVDPIAGSRQSCPFRGKGVPCEAGNENRPGLDSRAARKSRSGPCGEARRLYIVRSQKASDE